MPRLGKSTIIRYLQSKLKDISGDEHLSSSIGTTINYLQLLEEEEIQTNEIRDAMYEMLKKEGPSHRKVIFEHLVEQGIHIGGENPLSSMSSQLSLHSGSFVKLGFGVWSIR